MNNHYDMLHAIELGILIDPYERNSQMDTNHKARLLESEQQLRNIGPDALGCAEAERPTTIADRSEALVKLAVSIRATLLNTACDLVGGGNSPQPSKQPHSGDGIDALLEDAQSILADAHAIATAIQDRVGHTSPKAQVCG